MEIATLIELIGSAGFAVVAFLLMFRLVQDVMARMDAMDQRHGEETAELRKTIEANTAATTELVILVKTLYGKE